MLFNGRLGEDRSSGKPTTKRNTTIDYFLGSPVIMKNVVSFRVLDFDPLLSDVHCGLCAKTKCELQSTVPAAIQEAQVSGHLGARPSKWYIEKQQLYVSNINVVKINELITKLEELSTDDINQELKNILIEPAHSHHMRKELTLRSQIMPPQWDMTKSVGHLERNTTKLDRSITWLGVM